MTRGFLRIAQLFVSSPKTALDLRVPRTRDPGILIIAQREVIFALRVLVVAVRECLVHNIVIAVSRRRWGSCDVLLRVQFRNLASLFLDLHLLRINLVLHLLQLSAATS